jgi:hypothetical protein
VRCPTLLGYGGRLAPSLACGGLLSEASGGRGHPVPDAASPWGDLPPLWGDGLARRLGFAAAVTPGIRGLCTAAISREKTVVHAYIPTHLHLSVFPPVGLELGDVQLPCTARGL